MGAYHINGRFVALNSASTSTSTPFFVGDFYAINVSWVSSASLGPSRLTIEGSNADGFQASDFGGATSTTNWSLVTGINLIGFPSYSTALTGLPRWLRATVAPANHSVASAVTVIFSGSGV